MAFTRYRGEGFVLKKENRGESDQLFTIYSRQFGKIKILGRAIRKVKSKLRAGIDIPYLARFEFIQGKTYKTLTDAVALKKMKRISSSPLKASVFNKISRLLDLFLAGGEKDEKIWLLAKEAIFTLENGKNGSGDSIKLFYWHFFWQLMSSLGYLPELSSCLFCRKKASLFNGIYFSPEDGGIVCRECFKKIRNNNSDKNVFKVSENSIKIIRWFIGNKISGRKEIRIPQSDFRLMEKISKAYGENILGGQMIPKND